MTPTRPFRLGVLVNPYAGIGGAMALKGSDGKQIREQALAMGASLEAISKMTRALNAIDIDKQALQVFTVAGLMGEQSCAAAALPCEIVYTPATLQTEAFDSEQAASALAACNLDLLLFAGGDGTARNLCHVLGDSAVVLGVPAGCKIHSGVYAVTPTAAGTVAGMMARGELVSEFDAEVKDIDEQACREGNVRAQHYGEMRVPHQLEYIQAVKTGGREHEELVLDDIAAYVSEIITEDDETYFVMGSGSTVAAIMQQLGIANTLLGVDVVHRGALVASDVTAQQLLQITQQKPVKLVVTVIGGQGHLFGRGNQQLSARFLHQLNKQDLLIVATKQKLHSLEGRPLRLDSGDEKLDQQFAGSLAVITGYQDKVLYPAQ